MNDKHQLNNNITIYRGLEKPANDDYEGSKPLYESFLKEGVFPRRKKNSKFHPGETADIDNIKKYLNGEFDLFKKDILDAVDCQVNDNDQYLALPCTTSFEVAKNFAFGKYTDDFGIRHNGSGNGFVLCIEVPESMLIKVPLYYSNAFNADKENEVLLPVKLAPTHIKEIKFFKDYKDDGSRYIINDKFDINAPLFDKNFNDLAVKSFCYFANKILKDDYEEKCAEAWSARCRSNIGEGYNEAEIQFVWNNTLLAKQKFNGNFQMFENAMKRVYGETNLNPSTKKEFKEYRNNQNHDYFNINNKEGSSFVLFNAKDCGSNIQQDCNKVKNIGNFNTPR